MRGAVTIDLATTPTADVRALIAELDEILSADYPPEQRHGLQLDAIFQPHIRFFVARVDGDAVGCGRVAFFGDFAEVKRMYVRGRGAAQALLARLETEARGVGLDVLRLETGARQRAAMRFYERSGFQRCVAFGHYVTMPPASIATSVFYEKRLGR